MPERADLFRVRSAQNVDYVTGTKPLTRPGYGGKQFPGIFGSIGHSYLTKADIAVSAVTGVLLLEISEKLLSTPVEQELSAICMW